jgi:hypothetical protein
MESQHPLHSCTGASAIGALDWFGSHADVVTLRPAWAAFRVSGWPWFHRTYGNTGRPHRRAALLSAGEAGERKASMSTRRVSAGRSAHGA